MKVLFCDTSNINSLNKHKSIKQLKNNNLKEKVSTTLLKTTTNSTLFKAHQEIDYFHFLWTKKVNIKNSGSQ